MEGLSFQCQKCGGDSYEIGQFRATGGTLSKIFDVQNRHFTTISCTRCHFTEVYRAKSGALGNIFDFLAGGG